MGNVRPLTWQIVLFVAMVIAAVVVGILFFLSLKNNPIPSTYPITEDNLTSAFNKGIIMSLAQLMQSTDKCQVASVQYFNITRRLVDIDCVAALLRQQNITLKGG